MKREELLEQAKSLGLADMKALIYDLRDLYSIKYNEVYIEVHVYPDTVIESIIKEETGFECYWNPVSREFNAPGRGTHVIVIPREKYSEELEMNLKNKYDTD